MLLSKLDLPKEKVKAINTVLTVLEAVTATAHVEAEMCIAGVELWYLHALTNYLGTVRNELSAPPIYFDYRMVDGGDIDFFVRVRVDSDAGTFTENDLRNSLETLLTIGGIGNKTLDEALSLIPDAFSS